MKLRYIALVISENYDCSDAFRVEFENHTRFISNYLSRTVRKFKYETDGSYNMILVKVGEENASYIGANNTMIVSVPFCQERYECIKGTEDCSYYLELCKEGFLKAAAFKDTSMQILQETIDSFCTNGYRNEWIYKKVLFRDIDLKVIMKCDFTTNHFRLNLEFQTVRNHKLLCSGTAIQTIPNEVAFDFLFRNVVLDHRRIYIVDRVECNFFYFDVDDIKQRVFALNVVDRPTDSVDGKYYDLVTSNNLLLR